MVPMLCHCTLAVSIVTHREGRRGEGGENGTHAVSIVTQRGREGETVPLLCLVNCNGWTPPNKVSNVISMDVCTTN